MHIIVKWWQIYGSHKLRCSDQKYDTYEMDCESKMFDILIYYSINILVCGYKIEHECLEWKIDLGTEHLF